MSGVKGGEPPGEPKRAKHGTKPAANVSLTPSPASRLHDMTRERIDALERDKEELKAEVARLLPYVAEKARLEEALGVAELIDVLATILIGIGGFLVSYATFTGKVAQAWANFAGGCLVSGIVMLVGQSVRRWRRR